MKAMVRFSVVVMLLSLCAIVSCEKDPALDKATLSIYVDGALEADSGGDVVRFGYEVKNRMEGVELVVECEEEWISNINVYESLIDVTVDRNNSEGERSATLHLSYGSESAEVTITQKVWNDPLTLTIDKIEATAVIISVAARDESTTWIGQIVGKEWFDSFVENGVVQEDKILLEDLTFFSSEASDAELSVEEYLRGILSKGSHSGIRMKGLDVESEYVVYVYGLNEYSEKTTELYYEGFKTTAPYEGNDVTYDIDIQCERALANITITPSHEGVAYYHNVTTREHFEKCGSDIKALVEDVVATALENYLYWEYTEEEFYEYNTTYLTSSYEFEGTANTEYVVFAFKWDDSLKPLSEISFEWYKTGEIPPSDNQLSMEISKVTQTTFYIDVKTTNNDPYTIFAVAEEEIKKMRTNDQIFEYIVDTYGMPELEINRCEGDVGGTFSGLEPDTDYAVLLFGYEAGVRTTPIVREAIHTTKAGDIESCLYDVEVTNVADRSAYVKITPSDYSVWYYWNVFEKSATEEQIKEYILDVYNSYYYADYTEFGYYEVTQGGVESNVSQLRPLTEYNVVVVPMHPKRYEYTGSVRYVGEFKTKEPVIADIKIEAGFDAYYDGDEVIALNVEGYDFSPYEGRPILPMTVTIDGECAEFLFTIVDYVDGLEDPTKYSDDVLLDTLYEVGAYWTPALFSGVWDKDLMIAAVAFDFSGNPSPVYRKCFRCARDGAGDPQEFIDLYFGGGISSAEPKPSVNYKAMGEDATMGSSLVVRELSHRPKGFMRAK